MSTSDPQYLEVILQWRQVLLGGVIAAVLDTKTPYSSWKAWVEAIIIISWIGDKYYSKTAMIFGIMRYVGLHIHYGSFTELYISWALVKFLPPWFDYVWFDNTELSFLEKAHISETWLRGFLIANFLTRALISSWKAALFLMLLGLIAYRICSMLPSATRGALRLYIFRVALDEDYSLSRFIVTQTDRSLQNLEHGERRLAAMYEAKAATPLEPYVYKPLDSRYIRLLRLHCRSLYQEPKCSLEHWPLDAVIEFEALSYCWGSQSQTVSLSVDGCKLVVGVAVKDFIWQHRTILWERYVWIDAVCINQDDLLERSMQVQLMREIYAKASRVIVWLHTPTPPTHMLEVRIMIKWLIIENASGLPVWGGINRLFNTQEKQNLAFVALRHFFSHPWFERTWIIQEVAAGRRVHVLYGGFKVDFGLISSAVEAIVANRTFNNNLMNANVHLLSFDRIVGNHKARSLDMSEQPKFVNVMIIDLARKGQQGEGFSLSTMLSFTTSFKVTDLRDKIFALVALTNDRAALLGSIDYNKTSEDVFLETARYILTTRDWAMVLYSAGRGYRPLQKPDPPLILPSWVPTWSHEYGVGACLPNLHELTQQSPVASALDFLDDEDSLVRRPIRLTDSATTISIDAFQFDSVQRMGPDRPIRGLGAQENPFSDLNGSDMRASMADWFSDLWAFARQHVSSPRAGAGDFAAVDEAVWATLMSGSSRRDAEYLSTTKVAMQKCLSYFRNPVETEQATNDLTALPEIMKGNLSNSITGRRLAVTSSGLPALVPLDTQEEDIIVHVRGTLRPFLLRSKQGITYDLVGTCYVFGVENGYEGSDWQQLLLD